MTRATESAGGRAAGQIKPAPIEFDLTRWTADPRRQACRYARKARPHAGAPGRQSRRRSAAQVARAQAGLDDSVRTGLSGATRSAWRASPRRRPQQIAQARQSVQGARSTRLGQTLASRRRRVAREVCRADAGSPGRRPAPAARRTGDAAADGFSLGGPRGWADNRGRGSSAPSEADMRPVLICPDDLLEHLADGRRLPGRAAAVSGVEARAAGAPDARRATGWWPASRRIPTPPARRSKRGRGAGGGGHAQVPPSPRGDRGGRARRLPDAPSWSSR